MGWLFAVVLFVLACQNGDEGMLLASGLYAIAGAIGYLRIKK